MKINIHSGHFNFVPEKVYDCLNNITKAVRPCYIYELLSERVNMLIWDRKYDNAPEDDLASINVSLSELAAVEVWS